MEAQQGYRNVSCLQEGIEQFSDTRVPDSYTVHVLHVFFKTRLQRRVLYSVLLTFEVTCSSNYWGHEVSPMVSLDSSLRAWKHCGPLILDCLHLFALFSLSCASLQKVVGTHLYLYIWMFMHYFTSESPQLHIDLQINLDVVLLLKCQKMPTHQIEIRFGVLRVFCFKLTHLKFSFRLICCQAGGCFCNSGRLQKLIYPNNQVLLGHGGRDTAMALVGKAAVWSQECFGWLGAGDWSGGIIFIDPWDF